MSKVRTAESEDLELLTDLMAEFYAESNTSFDRVQGASALSQILGDRSLGQIWLLQDDGQEVGYVVLTVGFSMEYGGRDAFVDDLFIRRGSRGQGLGRAALETLLSECRKRSIRAVHLEVDRTNRVAKELYRKFGFEDKNRRLLTHALTDHRSRKV